MMWVISACYSWVRHVSINTYAATSPVITVYSFQDSHTHTHTLQKHLVSHYLVLCCLMKRRRDHALCLNTRSTGAEVAGVQKIPSKRLCRTVNCNSCCPALSTGQRDDKIARILTILGSKPKTRIGNIFSRGQGQGQGLNSRGQGHILDDSNSDTVYLSYSCMLTKVIQQMSPRFQ